MVSFAAVDQTGKNTAMISSQTLMAVCTSCKIGTNASGFDNRKLGRILPVMCRTDCLLAEHRIDMFDFVAIANL